MAAYTSLENLIDTIKSYNPSADLEKVEKRFESVFNRISFSVILLAICIVMAGVIIALGNLDRSDERIILEFSTLAIVAGLILAVVIVIGIIISIIFADKRKKK